MTRNTPLIKGIERFSRSAAYRRRFLWKKTQHKTRRTAPKVIAKVKTPKSKVATPKVKPFGKETRTIKKNKGPSYYPEEDVHHRLNSRKHKHRPARLRSSIKPGSVLILVSGRFRGQRVVFLRQLKSGLLLVTGPFKVNGIPLRRVNQAYVIATSTRVDLSGIVIDKKFDDNYFRVPRKSKAASAKKDEKAEAPADAKKNDFFSSKKKKEGLPASKVEDQKTLDALLLPRIKKVPLLRQYLREQFTLRKGQYPHLLKF
jgi:large subunit ribosomal protein L6e